MKYLLHTPLSEMSSTPSEKIEGLVEKWKQHPFYKSALVLGLDIGIEGIGIWLRKGPIPLFAQTIIFEIPESSPLAGRRANRAARRARVSRKKREALLKKWIVKYGLLTEECMNAIWERPDVFQRGFEHRWRAIQKENALKSPEALVSCIRHCVQHRGYDYHLSNDASFPWGDDVDDSGKIINWAKRAICPPEAVQQWKRLFADASWSGKEDKWDKVMAALDETVRRYDNQAIRAHLEAHFRERNHPNLRAPARGENFPRELIKEHLRMICRNHASLFGSKEKMEAAVRELLGNSDQKLAPESIIDFHRKTQSQIERLWRRRTRECPFLPYLESVSTKPSREKRASNASPEIRRFKLLQFLAERTFVVLEGKKLERVHASAPLYSELMDILEKDILATSGGIPAASRGKRGKRALKGLVATAACVKLASDTISHNGDFFEQLSDLLFPKFSVLKKRSLLSATAARRLFELGMKGLTEFRAERVRENWADTYYQWRRNASWGGPLYPQVELLLGNPRQYDSGGRTKDRNGKNPQEHGILRRLFAGQFKDAHGHTVDLSAQLEGKTVPDYVIIETIGDIPRNAKQRRDLQKEQKMRRAAKDKLFEKYGLGNRATSEQIRRVLLFDQQAGKDGRAICPYTGDDLGDSPLAADLEIEHIHPRELGGISEMLNLVLTKRQINADKGRNTPFQIAGRVIGGTTFSSWEEMRKRAETVMKWNKAKRALFCREETTCPEWNSMTRVAQLARQLRDQVVRWIGVDDTLDDNARANEIARRIGTPTGAMTAACRESWKAMLPGFISEKKDRSNLRHHLYDAAVISHIPPREGMNLAAYGGIFVSDFNAQRGWVTVALPGLLPDLKEFDAAHQKKCLVYRPRNEKTKRARYDSTIYSPVDDEGARWTRFNAQLSEWRLKKSLEEIKQLLRAAGISQDKLPDKVIEVWYNQPQDKEKPALPLRFPAFKSGVPGQRIETVTRKSTKSCAEPAYAPHFDGRGNVIGWKVATDTFICCEIWKAEIQGKKGTTETEFYQRRVFHPRHLANLEKRKLKNGKRLTLKHPLTVGDLREISLVKQAEELRKRQEKALASARRAGRKKKVSEDLFQTNETALPCVPELTTSLHKIYCESDPIPEGATRVGIFRKGQVFTVPLDREDKFFSALPAGSEPPGGWWNYFVSAIKSDGEIELKLAEYKTDKESPRLASKPLRLRSCRDLALLLQFQNH